MGTAALQMRIGLYESEEQPHPAASRVRFYAHHGVDPQEQLTGAYFHVGMEADTDFNEAMQTDRLEGTVS